jgi:hypothetical protein
MARAVPHALVMASRMYVNTKVVACLHVYQAALMRHRTRKHACMQIVLAGATLHFKGIMAAPPH